MLYSGVHSCRHNNTIITSADPSEESFDCRLMLQHLETQHLAKDRESNLQRNFITVQQTPLTVSLNTPHHHTAHTTVPICYRSTRTAYRRPTSQTDHTRVPPLCVHATRREGSITAALPCVCCSALSHITAALPCVCCSVVSQWARPCVKRPGRGRVSYVKPLSLVSDKGGVFSVCRVEVRVSRKFRSQARLHLKSGKAGTRSDPEFCTSGS